MKLTFDIDGKKPDPYLGVMEGHIQEALNQVSTVELILVSQFCLDDEQCAEYIGKPVTLRFSDLFDGERTFSRFDGHIYELHVMDHIGVAKGLFKYQMIIRPKLWNLNFTVRSRTFPGQSRVAVAEAVLNEYSELDFLVILQKPDIYAPRDQIVQNQVSDLVFVQNLLREAGVNYFFCADKKDDTVEFLKVADNNIFFDEFKKPVIPYVPDSGQDGGYRIYSIETHFRAVPGSAVSVSELGDGKTQTFSAQRKVEGGNFGEVYSFDNEGESSDIPKKKVAARAEFYTSSRVLYEGRSNYFLFRPGEKFVIGDAYGVPEKEILMTAVFHHFRQTANAAVSGDNEVVYENLFAGTTKGAAVRPNQDHGKTIIELKRMFSERHSALRERHSDENENTRLEELEKYELKKKIADLQCELATARDYAGVMVGEVIEDAKVTQNKELVCRVKNDRFPEGLTIRVALGWLTQQGWLSLLPRKGIQVYFMFLNAHLGQHDAVLLGYRPTSDHQLVNPAQEQACPTTEPSEEGESAVGDTEFAPYNKWRNALMGENRVAEIAVIDGGEDTVFMHANKRIVANGDQSVSITTKSLTEKAGGASQSFGSLTRTVSGAQKVTVNDTATWTVTKNATLESTDEDVLIKGKAKIEAIDADGARVCIAGKNITSRVTDSMQLEITDSEVTATGKNAVVRLTENDGSLLVNGDGLSVTDSNATVISGDVYIDIQTSGKVVVNGKEIDITGSDKVTVTGSNLVEINGSKVKLNS